MCDFVCEKSILDRGNRQLIKFKSALERATRIELASSSGAEFDFCLSGKSGIFSTWIRLININEVILERRLKRGLDGRLTPC
jgi:hypothetical protein